MLCVIGYEHCRGVNKSGKNYELDIIHCVEVDRPLCSSVTENRTVDARGFSVTTIIWDNIRNGRLERVPALGDYLRLSYSRNSSFVSDIRVIPAEDIPVPHEPIYI